MPAHSPSPFEKTSCWPCARFEAQRAALAQDPPLHYSHTRSGFHVYNINTNPARNRRNDIVIFLSILAINIRISETVWVPNQTVTLAEETVSYCKKQSSGCVPTSKHLPLFPKVNDRLFYLASLSGTGRKKQRNDRVMLPWGNGLGLSFYVPWLSGALAWWSCRVGWSDDICLSVNDAEWFMFLQRRSISHSELFSCVNRREKRDGVYRKVLYSGRKTQMSIHLLSYVTIEVRVADDLWNRLGARFLRFIKMVMS